MKKFTLVFGSLFVISALVLPGLAHYFYQTHNHHNLAARPHTERVAPLNYYRQFYKDYYRCGRQGCDARKNIETPRYPGSVSYYNRKAETPVTSQNVNDISRHANTYQNRYIIVRNGNYIDRLGYDPSTRNQSTLRNVYNLADQGDYRVDTPRGFVATSNGDFRAPGTTLAYRVLALDESKCTLQNFWTCGQSQNRAFRNSDAFNLVRNVETSYRWNQTDHDNFEYFPTITESFDVTLNGRQYTYYTYTALNPIDKTMTRIEGVSYTAEKRTAAQTAYDVFESFRFN